MYPADSTLTELWDWFAFFLALTFAWAFWDAAIQARSLACSQGLLPARDKLQAQRALIPDWRRFLYFPSVLWISHADWFITGSLYACSGLALALALVPAVRAWPILFAVLWIVYASFTEFMLLYWPWDTLLKEVGFLAAFLPPPGTLPLPIVAFAFRFLACRLLLGFGKVKFEGSLPEDRIYLKPFMIRPPIASVAGWYAYFLPDWVHKASYAFYFLSESIVPVCLLLPWWECRLVGVISVVALMMGIQLSGNFGFFNILTSILALTALDLRDTPFYSGNPLHLSAVFAVYLLASCLELLISNSWIDGAWYHWRGLNDVPFRDICKWLQRFHMVHGFGVFPPHCFASCRTFPIFEGSADGESWTPYEFKSQITHESSWMSPIGQVHHPRFEYYNFYCLQPNLGLNSVTMDRGCPVSTSRRSGVTWGMMKAILAGNRTALCVFRSLPAEFQKTPPKHVRCRIYMFTPTSIAEASISGKRWSKRPLYDAIPSVSAEAFTAEAAVDTPYNTPECISFEQSEWRHLALSSLLSQPHEEVISQIPDFFWSAFVGQFPLPSTDEFDHNGVHSVLFHERQRFRTTFTAEQRARIEHCLGVLSSLLFHQWEAQAAAQGVKEFILGTYCYTVISRGREHYTETLAEAACGQPLPQEVSRMHTDSNLNRAMFYVSLFWFEHMRTTAKVVRLVAFMYQEDTVDPEKERRVPFFLTNRHREWQQMAFPPAPRNIPASAIPLEVVSTYTRAPNGTWLVDLKQHS